MPRSLKEWQDQIAEEMLKDLEKESGLDLSSAFRHYDIYAEETEDEDLDIDADGGDIEDYFDDLFDDLNVDADEEIDAYGDEAL